MLQQLRRARARVPRKSPAKTPRANRSDIFVRLGRQLQHLQRRKDADEHDERRHRCLQRGEQLVVERRLRVRGQLAQRRKDQPRHNPASEQRHHEEHPADRVMRDGVATRADIEKAEDHIDQMLEKIRRPHLTGRGRGHRRCRRGRASAAFPPPQADAERSAAPAAGAASAPKPAAAVRPPQRMPARGCK